MAWRIQDAVLRGEIDNRMPGRVTGKIWLTGIPKPVLLDLQGDCLRDLAGCRLEFTNPDPKNDSIPEGFHLVQQGSVGDMTAARKVRVRPAAALELTEPDRDDAALPATLANALYLEWFSTGNGRVVIESSRFQVAVSERAWSQSVEDERRQVKANESAMAEFLDTFTGAVKPDRSGGDREPITLDNALDEEGEKDSMNEFEAERFLQECDRRTDRYMELLDKYEDHPDQERIIARAMGWDHVDDSAERSAASEDGQPRGEDAPFGDEDAANEREAKRQGSAWFAENFLNDEDDEDAEAMGGGEQGEKTEKKGGEEDKVGDEEWLETHPLCERVHDLCVRMHQDSKQLGLEFHERDNRALHKLFRGIIYASGKLAGALNGNDVEDCLDPGITVAWLKRALNFLHEALEGAAMALDQNAAPKPWIESVRIELLEIRTEILQLMDAYRRQI